MEKLIIAIAPTGSVPTTKMNPNVPVTALEVIEDVIKCWKAGASLAHIHARDQDEKASHDPAFFQTREMRRRSMGY